MAFGYVVQDAQDVLLKRASKLTHAPVRLNNPTPRSMMEMFSKTCLPLLLRSLQKMKERMMREAPTMDRTQVIMTMTLTHKLFLMTGAGVGASR